MLSIIKLFKVFLSRLQNIGKYYGTKKAENEDDKQYLQYAENKRILSNLRRTTVFTAFMILYLLLVLVGSIFHLEGFDIAATPIILLGIVFFFLFIFIAAKVYEKGEQDPFNLPKDLKFKIQSLYVFYWTGYYIGLIIGETAFTDWYVGLSLWLPIMLMGFLVPVYSLQEGVAPMTVAGIALILMFHQSQLDFAEFGIVYPAAIIVICVTDINHVERVNAFYQEGKIYGESSASRRRLGNVFDEVFDIAFEFSPQEKTCVVLRNNDHYHVKYDKEEITLDEFGGFVEEMVHPDDLHIAKRVINPEYIETAFLVEGRSQIYCELRLLNDRDEYEWVSCLFCRESAVSETIQRGDYILLLIQNIEDRKKNESKLKLEAERDPLTQLYNKTTTRSLIEECIEKDASAQHALLVIDIDNFKTINDTRGHVVGDQILLAFANELSRNFRESDILGRAGGDEFVVLIKNIQSIALVCDKLQQLNSSFKKYGIDHGFPGRLSTSIGVAVFSKDGTTYEELFKKADQALYEAKRCGKDQYKFSITRS